MPGRRFSLNSTHVIVNRVFDDALQKDPTGSPGKRQLDVRGGMIIVPLKDYLRRDGTWYD